MYSRSDRPNHALAQTFEGQIAHDRMAGLDEAPQQSAVLDGKAAEFLDAFIFSSSKGGRTHVVSVHADAEGTRYVICTCKAMLAIDSRPDGCWAIKAARQLLGLPAIDRRATGGTARDGY